MAIYFPELYCPKGSVVEAIRDIEFDDFKISKNQKCYVDDIIGYGFDLYPLWDKTKLFRIKNGQMSSYFKVFASPKLDQLDITFSNYKARFKKEFSIDSVVTVKKGEEFYFDIDKTDKIFYNLYNDERKVLRLKESEANDFLEFFDI